MIERSCNLLQLLKNNYSVLILGTRGSGKSMYVNHLLDQFFQGRSLKINLLAATDFQDYLNTPDLLSKQVRVKVRESTRGVCKKFASLF